MGRQEKKIINLNENTESLQKIPTIKEERKKTTELILCIDQKHKDVDYMSVLDILHSKGVEWIENGGLCIKVVDCNGSLIGRYEDGYIVIYTCSDIKKNFIK